MSLPSQSATSESAAIASPGGVREAVQTFCLLLLFSALFTALRWLADDAAPGLPRLLAQEAPYAWPRLWLWTGAISLLLVATFPTYPALRYGWWRELLPLLAGAVILAPGFPLICIWHGPPEPLLLAVVAFTLWCRRRQPGWVALKAAVRDHLPRPGPRAVVLTLGGVLLVYLFGIQFTEMDKVATGRTDFVTLYRAAEMLAAAGDPYRDLRGFMYPPSFAFWFQPLTALGPVEASLLWFILKLTLVIWTFHLADCLLVGRALTGHRRGWFLVGLVMVAGRFWATDQQFGNTNNLVLFLMVGTLAWSGTRPWRSGACLALATTVKVVPALLAFYLVVTRRWRALSWTAGVLMLLNLIPLATAPEATSRAWSSYYGSQASTSVTDRRDQPDNQSLWGALARELPIEVPYLRLVWATVSVGAPAAGALDGLAGRKAVGRWRRESPPRSGRFWRSSSRREVGWCTTWPCCCLWRPCSACCRADSSRGGGSGLSSGAPIWSSPSRAGGAGRYRLAADRSLFLLTAVVIYVTLCWLLGRAATIGQLRRENN